METKERQINYLSKEWHIEQGHNLEAFGRCEKNEYGEVVRAEVYYKCDCDLPIRKSRIEKVEV